MRPLLLVLLTYCQLAIAQQHDSVQTTYSQEVDSLNASQQNRLLKALYRRFIRAQIEERTLIKLAILPSTIGVSADGNTIWGFKSELAIERKLTPALSILLAGRTQYRRTTLSPHDATVINGVLAGRWYFNMLRRIRQRRSANNFSDQYLTLELNTVVWSKAIDSYPTLIPIYNQQAPSIRVAIGAQRRLGRLVYLDTMFGADYSQNRPTAVVPMVAFWLGLGL